MKPCSRGRVTFKSTITASSELKSAADLYLDIGSHLEDFKAVK